VDRGTSSPQEPPLSALQASLFSPLGVAISVDPYKICAYGPTEQKFCLSVQNIRQNSSHTVLERIASWQLTSMKQIAILTYVQMSLANATIFEQKLYMYSLRIYVYSL